MFDAFKNIMNSPSKAWSASTEDGEREMMKRLSQQTEIRIYVDNAPNFGNQASSVLLMRTLVDRYGFRGAGKTVRMVYKTERELETREKLSLLIQGFSYTNPEAVTYYHGVVIRFANIDAGLAAAPEVSFGFSGAADTSPDDNINWFATKLKVAYFLRMQPYLWPGIEQIQFRRPLLIPFDFNEKVGKKNTFMQRGWYVDESYWQPTIEDWTYYKTASNPGVGAEMAWHSVQAHAVVAFLMENPQILFMPVYGVKGGGNQMLMFPDQILPTIISAALACSVLTAPSRPCIVLSLNDNISEDDYNITAHVSKGGISREEVMSQRRCDDCQEAINELTDKLTQIQRGKKSEADPKEIQENLNEKNDELVQLNIILDAQKERYSGRTEWLKKYDAKNRVKFYSSKPRSKSDFPNSGEGLQNGMKWLIGTAEPKVLFMELGALPTILFNKIMSLASLPRVFEGANTANLNLNLGSCYLRMRSAFNGEGLDRYPSAELGVKKFDDVISKSYAAANAVTSTLYSEELILPPDFNSNMSIIMEYIYGFYIKRDEALTEYYREIRIFYHNPSYSKLAIGLAYLNLMCEDVELKEKIESSKLSATGEIQ
ncbi:hypothetical protein [Massilia sp. erpn]|uniref:hypothetical protein n=1 Tax=Massilia sp. erpn TaxID=2738142 RepID=UPI0021050D12|nr:hypothetical protein [Massilia sp. erpn]UTY59516.1 hypothetical protein HPQ68_21465 [Massilia sp. erpn]